ncbi:hypothetical protein [Nocardia donostiensis]|nr:hypothetical protein [Nocardia donostiensis]
MNDGAVLIVVVVALLGLTAWLYRPERDEQPPTAEGRNHDHDP